MLKKTHNFLIGFSVTTALVATAADTPEGPVIPPCTPIKPSVVWLNGMNNTFDDSFSTKKDIEQIMKDHKMFDDVDSLNLHYNPTTDSAVEDLLKSAVVDSWGKVGLPLVTGVVATVNPNAAAWLVDEQILATARMRVEIDAVKALIKTSLSRHQPIVIIAHSQGNQIVNRARAELEQDKFPGLDHLAILSLASPEGAPKGKFDYIKDTHDTIITSTPHGSDLPGNVTATLYDAATGRPWVSPPDVVTGAAGGQEFYGADKSRHHSAHFQYLQPGLKAVPVGFRESGSLGIPAEEMPDLFARKLKALTASAVDGDWPCP